jgi:peptidoglycan-N-acetylglucosamine deacetylase
MTIQRWARRGATAAFFALVATAAGQSSRPRYWGFTAPWDDRSDESVEQHDAVLGAVVSAWIGLDSATGLPVLLYPDETPRGPAPRFAMITTASEGRFHPELIRRIGADTALASRVADSVARILTHGHYRGLVIDFEDLKAPDTVTFLATVRALTRAAHARHVSPVSVTIVGYDSVTYPVRRLLERTDRVIVMAYDQHWQTGPPGPIASPDWVTGLVKRRLAEAGPANGSRVAVALPVYGYRWPAHGAASVIGYNDARRLPLVRDSASLNMHAPGRDSSQVWLCDAVTLDTLADRVRALGPRTLALWRLGLEDPKMWR